MEPIRDTNPESWPEQDELPQADVTDFERQAEKPEENS
jgi:hypothetical protein